MAGKNKVTHLFRPVTLQYFPDGKEVAQRLGHLLFIHFDETVVHPEIDKRFTGRGFGLGNFILMMRERQIHATAMNVEVVTEAMC